MPKFFVAELNCESRSLESSHLELPFVHAKIHPGLKAHVAARGRPEGLQLGIKWNFLGEPLMEGGFG